MKKLEFVILIGVAAFVALGYTAMHRGVRTIYFGRRVTATGPMSSQSHSVGDFDRITAEHAFDVDVKFGSTPSVEIEAPADLLPHLTANVESGTLVLTSDSYFDIVDERNVRAHVVATHLVGASASGASEIVINGGVKVHEFEASASGAASIQLSAAVDTFRIELSGSAKAKIDALTAKTLNVQASGASDCYINGDVDSSTIDLSGSSRLGGMLSSTKAEVQASGASAANLRVRDSISGEASGASSISYSGSPVSNTVQTSGVSSVNHRG